MIGPRPDEVHRRTYPGPLAAMSSLVPGPREPERDMMKTAVRFVRVERTIASEGEILTGRTREPR